MSQITEFAVPYQQKRRIGKHTFPALPSIQKYLEIVTKETQYIDVFEQGPIRHKHSFIRYIHWLTEKGFVKKRLDYYGIRRSGQMVKIRKKPSQNPNSYYTITDKGLQLLELIR